jgi:hypothetical protein
VLIEHYLLLNGYTVTKTATKGCFTADRRGEGIKVFSHSENLEYSETKHGSLNLVRNLMKFSNKFLREDRNL